MLNDKSLKYRKLRAFLAKHGVYEIKHRGKGSHRLFVHDNINGKKVSMPVKCHNEGQEVHSYIVCRIRHTFQIPIDKFYD